MTRRHDLVWPLALGAVVVPAYLFTRWTGSFPVFILVTSLVVGFVLGAALRAPDRLLVGAITALWLVYIAVVIALPGKGREPIPDVVAAVVGALFAVLIPGGSFVGVRLGRRVRRPTS